MEAIITRTPIGYERLYRSVDGVLLREIDLPTAEEEMEVQLALSEPWWRRLLTIPRALAASVQLDG
jgi:hypothetical protein